MGTAPDSFSPIHVTLERTEQLLRSKKPIDGVDESLLKQYLEHLVQSLNTCCVPRSERGSTRSPSATVAADSTEHSEHTKSPAFSETDAVGLHAHAVSSSTVAARWQSRVSSAVTAPAKPPYTSTFSAPPAKQTARQLIQQNKAKAAAAKQSLNPRSAASAGAANPGWLTVDRSKAQLAEVQASHARRHAKARESSNVHAAEKSHDAVLRATLAASLLDLHGGDASPAHRPRRVAAAAAAASLTALRVAEALDSPPRRSKRRTEKRRRSPLRQLFAFPAPFSATVEHMRTHGFLPQLDAGNATDSEVSDGNSTDDTIPATGVGGKRAPSALDCSDSSTDADVKLPGGDAIDLVSDSSAGASSDSVVVQGYTESHKSSMSIPRGGGRHPMPAKLGAVPVSNWDAECLEAGEYLNDSIIDWALKYRLLRGVDEAARSRVHVMSSLFLKELRSHTDDSMGSLPPVQRYAAGYRQVAKWTRKVDIFKKDFIIIPVNDSLHWSLIVVCYPSSYAAHAKVWCEHIKTQNTHSPNLKKSLEAVNLSSKATSYPFLLMMDSLAAHDVRETCDCVRAWLACEFAERHPDSPGKEPEDTLTNSHLLPHFNVQVPRQTNSFDCGVFVICYAEMVLQAIQHHRIEAPFLQAGGDIDILLILPKMLDYTFGRGTFQAQHVSRVRGRLMATLKRLQRKNAVLVCSVPHQEFEELDPIIDVLSDDIKLPARRDATEFAQRVVGAGVYEGFGAPAPAAAAAAASAAHIGAITHGSGTRGSQLRRLADLALPLRANALPRRLESPPKDLAVLALPSDVEDSLGASDPKVPKQRDSAQADTATALACARSLAPTDADAISVSSADSAAAVEQTNAQSSTSHQAAAAASITAADDDSISSNSSDARPLSAPAVTASAPKQPRRGAHSSPGTSYTDKALRVVGSTVQAALKFFGSSSLHTSLNSKHPGAESQLSPGGSSDTDRGKKAKKAKRKRKRSV